MSSAAVLVLLAWTSGAHHDRQDDDEQELQLEIDSYVRACAGLEHAYPRVEAVNVAIKKNHHIPAADIKKKNGDP
jgi:hypothetical protein